MTCRPAAQRHGGATSLAAVVEFGRADVGSPFPPPDHDRSFHAKDKRYPRTTVIAVGGTVTFRVGAVHLPAVYEPGTEPEDIEISAATQVPSGIPELPLVFDDDGLVAREAFGPQFFTDRTWSHTFTAPGRYLVICAVIPHFQVANMYGWVIVQ